MSSPSVDQVQHALAFLFGERFADTARDHPGGMDFLAAEHLDDRLADLPQPNALREPVAGCRNMTPKMLRSAGSQSQPSSRSGDERWKNDSACDCVSWARFINRRS